jgi:uncharacterized protein
MSTTTQTSELTPQAATGTVAAPTRPGRRIVALDALRGFAILGILVMNIQSFSMIFAAYQNPAAYGDLTGLNRWVWIVGHLFFDLKFMAMFAMMFGAGILLITESAARKGVSPARLHYTRNIWLLLFGLVHAYLFWSGDILAAYAVCGFVVYFFRRLSPRWLVAIGLVLIGIPSLIQVLGQASLPFMPAADYVEMRNDWQPTAAMVAEEVAAFRGEWPAQMEQRVEHSLEMHTLVFFIYMGWRVAGLMLLGMALYKWGVLTAQRSRRFYARMSLVGFSSGLPLVIAGVWQNFAHDWDFAYSMFTGSQFNYWGSLPVSLGYIGLIMYIATSGRMAALVDRFAAVGRMALTNYFLQTLIATTLFYGHGLGWFGQVERTGQLLIVLAVWAVQLIVSPIWLTHFRFGPFEWLWRSLTYRRWQPLRRLQPVG